MSEKWLSVYISKFILQLVGIICWDVGSRANSGGKQWAPKFKESPRTTRPTAIVSGAGDSTCTLGKGTQFFVRAQGRFAQRSSAVSCWFGFSTVYSTVRIFVYIRD